jgi:hypothetical protein
MTEGPGAKDAPPPPTDAEHTPGQDLFGLGERDRQAALAWIGEHLTRVRRSVYEQRLLHRSLWTGVVVVLFVQIIPEAKRRQFKQALDAYEAAQREEARAGGDQALGDDGVPTAR